MDGSSDPVVRPDKSLASDDSRVEPDKSEPTAAQIRSADDMRRLGKRLAGQLRAGDLVLLRGPLGAGKTTLVQGIGDGLAVRGPITSPTFVLARVHPALAGGPPLVHVDAYRLEDWDDLETLDLEATLDESVTVVEWGEGLVEGLADDRLEVRIHRAAGRSAKVDMTDGDLTDGDLTNGADDDDPRQVEIVGVGRRWRGITPAA